jgi:hypothetical protein
LTNGQLAENIEISLRGSRWGGGGSENQWTVKILVF